MGTAFQTKHRVVDFPAGGLVWVRRRNGSWWPGRVMGLDELPEMCSHSPRLGTPVKLLGRKDVNVDWYNLEKSSCVKAFRCGDFDECIKKAKASSSNCTKTGFKYSRRDDAILHALKIESVQESNCSHQYCSREDNIIGNVAVDSCSTQSAISLETMNAVNVSKEDGFTRKKKRKTPNDSEDDGTEGSKRMRDLDDIGLRLIPVQNSGENSEVVFSDSNSLGGSDICDSLSSGSPENSSKGFFVYLRRRHSNVDHCIHDGLKRKSHCRPLSEVLEGTATVDCSALGNGVVADARVSGVESLESVKTNGTDNNSDSTDMSCQKKIASSNVYEDSANDALGELHSGAKSHNVCTSEVAFIQSNSKAHGHICCASCVYEDCTKGGRERGNSKMGLRRKRNSALFGRDVNSEDKTVKSKVYLMNENDFFRGSVVSDSWGQLRYGSIRRKKQIAAAHSISGNGDSFHSAGIFPGQHSHSMSYSPVMGYLFDVHLEVQATYRGEYVPLISVTSKLNGKSIVGHSITVDVLEDGFCDRLTSVGLCHKRRGCKLSGLQKTEPLIDVVVQKHHGGYLPQRIMEAEVCNPSFSAVGLERLPKMRKCGGLPKKTRKLSSFVVGRVPREEERRVALLDGGDSPDTACVPLKVVFTRINESLSL